MLISGEASLLAWGGSFSTLSSCGLSFVLIWGKKTERVREREISRFLVSFPLIKAIESD